ncbi:hypothetical protein CPB84DRAFT_237037 [Gymnopilus junonius]|uniref:Protein F37C4.5 n=1 Tax=Gymnopilus junonius TaxID=109634 RepID=A0A9P5THH3_GYMJU|nr:hypothetical protein CPB84DRAFT_237037 [Gymnopilus junonius]
MVTTEIHTLALDSTRDGTITHVNLYQDLARVTRSYTINVAAGQTKLTISSLPNVMDYESLRVEGRGAALIQGVTAFKDKVRTPDETSPLLKELKIKEAKAKHALERCKKAIGSIDQYMGNISVEHLDISKLGEAMDIYDTTEDKWDSKMFDLEEELEAIEKQIEVERKRLGASVGNKKLRTVVAIDLYAADPAELKVNLLYAVSQAHWRAAYDIRVDMENKERTVQLVYKAGISQQTGEAWNDIPILLETAQPTFGLEPPSLNIWHVSHTQKRRPTVGGKAARKAMTDPSETFIKPLTATVDSEGYVNATFQLPGLTTVPSDDEERNVVIAELELPVKMAWTCVPKLDTRVFLEATIMNTSEFTLLTGESSVYVDQCFIACSEVSDVSPGETFKTHLGVDPTIRVIYHPQTNKVAETGFYHKSMKHTYSQRITIHNTKPINVEGLRITDNIPVSDDANITVHLLSPALAIPAPNLTTTTTKVAVVPAAVNVAEGVIAQWNGADDPDVDVAGLGEDGHLDWVCDVPAQKKINLVLEYEVATSEKGRILGL